MRLVLCRLVSDTSLRSVPVALVGVGGKSILPMHTSSSLSSCVCAKLWVAYGSEGQEFESSRAHQRNGVTDAKHKVARPQ